MTQERELSASAILEYFHPLQQWLEAYNGNGSVVGEHASTNGSNAQPIVGDDQNVRNEKHVEDQTVPIVVGSVIGVLVIIAIIAYLVIRKRRNL